MRLETPIFSWYKIDELLGFDWFVGIEQTTQIKQLLKKTRKKNAMVIPIDEGFVFPHCKLTVKFSGCSNQPEP